MGRNHRADGEASLYMHGWSPIWRDTIRTTITTSRVSTKLATKFATKVTPTPPHSHTHGPPTYRRWTRLPKEQMTS